MARARRQSTDPLERYYSRPEFVAPLVRWLRLVDVGAVRATAVGKSAAARVLRPEDGPAIAVEPCVGNGAIVLGFQRAGVHAAWRTLDLDPHAPAAMWVGDWMRTSGSWRAKSVQHKSLLDRYHVGRDEVRLVATNPPFSRAIEVVETAWLRHPRAVVAILQRQTWYEPTEARAKFFIDHPPDVINIGRCPFLAPDGKPIGRGSSKPVSGGSDNASCAWFVWGPDRVGLAGGMARIIPWRKVA